jgi:hypothetical protein
MAKLWRPDKRPGSWQGSENRTHFALSADQTSAYFGWKQINGRRPRFAMKTHNKSLKGNAVVIFSSDLRHLIANDAHACETWLLKI